MFSLRDGFVNSFPPIGAVANYKSIWRRIVSTLRSKMASNGGLEHVGNLTLTTHASLSLVRWHDRTLLLGITPQTITLLTSSEEVKNHSAQEMPSASNHTSCREDER